MVLKKHLVHPKPKLIAIPGEQRSTLSLSPSLSFPLTFPHVFAHSLSPGSTTRARGRPRGSRGQSVNTKQKLWTLAFPLASLRTRWDFSMARQRWDIGNPGATSISTYINVATAPSPVRGTLERLPCHPVEEPGFRRRQNHSPEARKDLLGEAGSQSPGTFLTTRPGSGCHYTA